MATSTLATPTSFLPLDCDVEHGPLQHPLETQRRLHLALLGFVEARGGLVDVLLDLLLELREVCAAGAQDLADFGRIEDREQQVLDRQIFVACLARLVKGVVEAVFKLVRKHDLTFEDWCLHQNQASSRVHISGC